MSREPTMRAQDTIDPAQRRDAGRVMHDFLAAREASRVADSAARRTAISAVLADLVAILSTHGARRAWVFGSFVDGPFDEHSDLDLATEGLPADHYFTVRAALSDLCPTRFDLVELERAPPTLRAEILTHGLLVHDATRADQVTP